MGWVEAMAMYVLIKMDFFGKVKNLIETIQADCLLVAKDKGDYAKNNFDYSGVDHDDSLFGN